MTADVFTLANATGMVVRFAAYGGVIMSMHVPDRNGVVADIAPGYDTPDDYERDGRYFGALIGRYANRIAGARIRVDGVEHQLDRNDGANQLHGGHHGFHNTVWAVEPFTRAGESGAVLSFESPAGDQGFPGKLSTRAMYTLTDGNAFSIDFSAATDAATPVSVTQHAYFNLAGHDAGSIADHELLLNADLFTPVRADLIPTGEVRSVKNTAFDFTSSRSIGGVIDCDDEQLRIAGGFDHNFVLRAGERSLRHAATVYEPTSGRVLEILTTEPGVQFYSGNGLAGGPLGKGGFDYPRRGAFALETQHFPDSPNQPEFPTTILRPGVELSSRTVWQFSTRAR
ncbi:MAG: aldose epimerase family protein [Gemmatimonadaceae bacterium]